MSKHSAVEPTADEKRVDTLLDAIDELPSIPETLIRILKLLDDPQSSAQELADVVRLDAPLMAKILRLANSPYYSGGRNLADIQSCVSVLGFKTVRQVAICVSIASSLVARCNKKHCHIDYRDLWGHSVVSGVLAKQLGSMMGDPDPEELFTAGLLHDLGKFVIILQAPELYDKVITQRKQDRRPLLDVELEHLGYDHTMAGEAFSQAWRFPSLLVHCTRYHHHRPPGGPVTNREERAACLVSLADYWSHRLEPSQSDLGYDHRFVESSHLCNAVGINESTIDSNENNFRNAIQNASAFMELA